MEEYLRDEFSNPRWQVSENMMHATDKLEEKMQYAWKWAEWMFKFVRKGSFQILTVDGPWTQETMVGNNLTQLGLPQDVGSRRNGNWQSPQKFGNHNFFMNGFLMPAEKWNKSIKICQGQVQGFAGPMDMFWISQLSPEQNQQQSNCTVLCAVELSFISALYKVFIWTQSPFTGKPILKAFQFQNWISPLLIAVIVAFVRGE